MDILQKVASLPIYDSSGQAAGCVGGWLQGTTKPLASALGDVDSLPTFVVASVTNVGHKRLGTLSLDALYAGDGKLHHAALTSR